MNSLGFRKMEGRELGEIIVAVGGDVIGLEEYVWSKNNDEPLREAVKRTGPAEELELEIQFE